ncbi:hypothetical protein FSOLCH5_012484 [Fusarium solani]|nr:hypothetical protein NW759_011843 [Fusarium solani]
MDGWMDGLVVGNCRPSSSVNPLLLFGLARAEWNMPRQIADPVTFWRSFPPALSFSLDSPCTLFEPVLTVPLSPDSCLKTSSLGDSGTPSRFQLTRPSQVTTSVFLFCRFADPAPSSKPAFATRITCCFFITLQASKAISTLDTMAAIKSLITRDEVVNQLVKREKNWAAREPGVMVVFCIVGVVAIGLISLFIHKKLAARKANKAVVV